MNLASGGWRGIDGETGMINKATGAFRHRNEIAVQLRLNGDDPTEAFIFCVNGERITDLLNDSRAFIPIRTSMGDIQIVAKSQIASISERESDQSNTDKEDAAKSPPKSFDPFQVLRVSPTVSDHELRTAFNARIKAVHPDTVASLGLDDDLAIAASKATQKIIYAYRKIMRERNAAA